MHLLWCALEESAAAANEKGITGEDRPVVAILEKIADAVLSVAWCVQCTNFD